MRPNSANGNNPRLITDESGRVVLDSKYILALQKAKAAAEADKKTNGANALDDRLAFIMEMTGLSKDKFVTDKQYKNALKNIQNGNSQSINQVVESLPASEGKANVKKLSNELAMATTVHSIKEIEQRIKRVEKILDKDVKEGGFKNHAYGNLNKKGGINWWPQTGESLSKNGGCFDALFNGWTDGEGTFHEATFKFFDEIFKYDEALPQQAKDAADNILKNIILPAVNTCIENGTKHDDELLTIYRCDSNGNEDSNGTAAHILVNLGQFYKMVADNIGVEYDLDKGFTYYDADKTIDIDLDGNGQLDDNEKGLKYSNLSSNLTKYKNDLTKANQIYDMIEALKEGVFDAEEDRLIAFYDKVFTAISENGYSEDARLSDTNYLNQMLQNNKYYVTTVADNGLYYEPEDGEIDTRQIYEKKKYNYKTTLASNNDNIFAVNNEAMRQEALSKYEYQKSIINNKEKRIDNRMATLDLELNSLKKMMEGLKAVRDGNIDRTFKANG